jgi:hypothetical protein
MLRARALSIAVIMAISAMAAAADSIDPYIHIGDPAAGAPVGPSFQFTTDPRGGGVFNFYNASNVTFSSLDFFVTLPASDTITCVAPPFYASCTYTVTPVAGTSTATFDIGADSGPGAPGIAPGTPFQLILNDPYNGKDNLDPFGPGSWGPNRMISAVANLDTTTTPEPATWGLLLTGAALTTAFFRRTRR